MRLPVTDSRVCHPLADKAQGGHALQRLTAPSSKQTVQRVKEVYTKMNSQPNRQTDDHLKFWHCDYCHRGLVASELHDITDHKVRCHDCAAKGEGPSTPIYNKVKDTPDPTPTPEVDDDLADFKNRHDRCWRRAVMLWGMLVGHGYFEVPEFGKQDLWWADPNLAVSTLYEGLALLDGIPFKDE